MTLANGLIQKQIAKHLMMQMLDEMPDVFVWNDLIKAIELNSAEFLAVKSLQSGLRPYGLEKGNFYVTDAFFEPLPNEVLDVFEGK